ncbi:OLC1v1026666C2 [Oldenlandia corymbosa var. corymbosa]|uniref:OLC1v1026666C2 n=1 Tax=Oldenlandia corymbosa var. corymbosa TaxID=529605 RepID=A0AAV1C809_OLDCO|nr:OLC1v1026666C2 [Oldenlandia corymbosa var. corymbosa]
MEEKHDEAEFWLPSEFLTDEDILMDHKKSISPGLRFPAPFPFDYGSSALSSPVESLVGSTETESSDEEDFLLTGLTRQLSLRDAPKFIPTQPNQEKANMLSGSPQSTLTKVGSWSGRSSGSSNGSPNGPSQVSSPPTTPLAAENDPWDLIYQAAGQIARLKMSSGDNHPSRNPGILGPPKRLPTPPPLQNKSASCFYEPQVTRQDACGMWSREVNNGWRVDSQEILQNISGRIGVGIGGNGMGPSPCVWSSQQRNPQFGDFGVKGRTYVGAGYGYGFGYGSSGGVGGVSGGLKRERSGTGVFLPRRYENNNYNSKASEYRKRPGSPAMFPHKPVQTFNGNVQSRSCINSSNISPGDYEAALARKNALLAQQRRNLCPETTSTSQEICLPPEWTY